MTTTTIDIDIARRLHHYFYCCCCQESSYLWLLGQLQTSSSTITRRGDGAPWGHGRPTHTVNHHICLLYRTHPPPPIITTLTVLVPTVYQKILQNPLLRHSSHWSIACVDSEAHNGCGYISNDIRGYHPHSTCDN